MDQTVELLNYLRGTGQIEISIECNRVSTYKDCIGQKNRYFCGGLGEKTTKRAKDDDIKTKRYFVADIDIRLLHYDRTGVVLTQDELNLQVHEILKRIDEIGLGDYSAVVRTGNGIHIYYTGIERAFDKEVYADGVTYIYSLIDTALEDLGYCCDPACHNLARLTRLPGSINPRYKKRKDDILWDLGDYTCDILYFEGKDSRAFEDIEKNAIVQKEKNAHIKQEEKIVKDIIQKEYVKSSDMWRQINDIPAWQIACDIWGVTVGNMDLDNVPLRESKKNMGAYWWRPHNVIVNTDSSMIKTKHKRTFTSYELVYHELMGEDGKKTVEYFRDKYGIVVDTNKKQIEGIVIPVKEYEKQGYLYGNSTFDSFDCVMSGELLTVIAQSNSGKTSFAMDMIQTNASRGKKCFYINLEFDIRTMWESRWLFLNGKKKRNLTDIDPLAPDDRARMDRYVDDKLKQFVYYNSPKGMSLEDLVTLIIDKSNEGYGFFVVDTFSRITGNLDSKIAHTSQNKSMEVLQELCQGLGVVIMMLHHTNKKGEFEGSQKIMDMSNVFIVIERDEDMNGYPITKFALTKDKYQTKIELDTYYINQQYSLQGPPPPEKPF